MAAIANTELSNTFDFWRINHNGAIQRLNTLSTEDNLINITDTDTDPNIDYYTALVTYNSSGAGAVSGGNKVKSAIRIDGNYSATGGTVVNGEQLHINNSYITSDNSGDPYIYNGELVEATTTHSAGDIFVQRGLQAEAKALNPSPGTITYLQGVRGISSVSSSGDVLYAYGGSFTVDAIATSSGSITTALGVAATVRIDEISTASIGSARGVAATIDMNGSTATSVEAVFSHIDIEAPAAVTGNAIQFYGLYASGSVAEVAGTSYGLYMSGEDTNYLSGNLDVVGNLDAGKIDITATDITNQALAITDTDTVSNIQHYAARVTYDSSGADAVSGGDKIKSAFRIDGNYSATGGTAVAGEQLHINNSYITSDNSGDPYVHDGHVVVTTTTHSAGDIFAQTGTNSINYANHSSPATITYSIGVEGESHILSSGDITYMYGGKFRAVAEAGSSGSITTLFGVEGKATVIRDGGASAIYKVSGGTFSIDMISGPVTNVFAAQAHVNMDGGTAGAVRGVNSSIDIEAAAAVTGDATLFFAEYTAGSVAEVAGTSYGLYITGEDTNYLSGNLDVVGNLDAGKLDITSTNIENIINVTTTNNVANQTFFGKYYTYNSTGVDAVSGGDKAHVGSYMLADYTGGGTAVVGERLNLYATDMLSINSGPANNHIAKRFTTISNHSSGNVGAQYGIYGFNEARNTATGTIAENIGIRVTGAIVEDGDVTSLGGGAFVASSYGTATGNVIGMYGSASTAVMSGTSAITTAYGSKSKVDMDAGTAGTMYGTHTNIDIETAGAVSGNAYLYWGEYSTGSVAEVAGTSYGLYITGEDTNHLSGDLTVGGEVITSSDERFKNNVININSDDALKTVAALRPVSYTRDNSVEINYGLLAQEVAKVLPDIVRGNEEDGYSLAYTDLIAVLIGAVQDLDARVKELEIYGR